MTTELQNLTKEQVAEMVAKAQTDLKKQLEEAQAHIKALNEENKNKRLDSKELKATLAETLGLGEQTLTTEEIIKGLQNKVSEFENKLVKAEKEKELVIKKTKAKDLIKALNPHNTDDVMAFVNVESETLEADIKALAENKKYLFKPANIGGSSIFANPSSSLSNPWKKETLNYTTQYEIERANPTLAIRLKKEAGIN